jgi:hypothetical protein
LINSLVKCVMHVILSNSLLLMIRSKCRISKIYVVSADDARWTMQCIFEIAQISHCTIFEISFSFISMFSIFLNWLIILERQWSSLKCQFHDVIFAVVFLWNCSKLTNFSIERYSSRNNSCIFSISQIIVSNKRFISVFL